eukprot:2992383-Pyramimonas_sp.AAC.2
MSYKCTLSIQGFAFGTCTSSTLFDVIHVFPPTRLPVKAPSEHVELPSREFGCGARCIVPAAMEARTV